MNRAESLARAGAGTWDVIVVGGGATGAGVAVDAASRGYSVLLLERFDFAAGTSSRSTKLVHGGVRYLARGEVRLVAESLRERKRLLANAPHLVHTQGFIVPAFSRLDAPYYGLGLTLYDLLSGGSSLGRSRYLNRREVLRQIPTIRRDGLRGGILYFDGQFDDARLVVNLMQTATEFGAAVLNRAPVERFLRDSTGRASGVAFRDSETGNSIEAIGRVVVNATGAFCDGVRKRANPDATPMVAPSQGAHLVFDRSFLPGVAALMVPKTSDGRVLFAIPWQGHTVVGTTDVAVREASAEPRATEAEIEFILETAGQYLAKTPRREDVRAVFAGIRPLVKAGASAGTAALARDFTLREEDGLLTVTGGKWTTYRSMAESTVDRAAAMAGLPARRCRTANLRVHGFVRESDPGDPLRGYGSDAPAIRDLRRRPDLAAPLHADFPQTGAEVAWAARHEMARTVDDVLARRMRVLVLDAAAASAMAPRVARILASEHGRDAAWEAGQVTSFLELADGYRTVTSPL